MEGSGCSVRHQPGLSESFDFELWSLLDATAFAVARLRQMELARLGLTIEQAAILDLLHRVGGSTSAKEIERITMRQHNSISILISRMIRSGLLSREHDSNKRSYAIFLTDSGMRLLGNMPLESISPVFSPMTNEDRRFLATCLSDLHERSRQLLGMPYTSPFTRHSDRHEADVTSEESNEPSDYRLWSLLNRTRFAIGRLRELELAQFGVTVEQASILHILNDSGGTTSAKALRATTLRQHHSISTLVNRMTRIGLIHKRTPRQREGHVIAITEKGRGVVGGMTTSAVDMTISALRLDEKRKLASCLRVLNERARRLLSSADGSFATSADRHD